MCRMKYAPLSARLRSAVLVFLATLSGLTGIFWGDFYLALDALAGGAP